MNGSPVLDRMPELESVAALWHDALSRIEFEFPPAHFVERLVKTLDGSVEGSGADTSATFALKIAIRLQATGVAPETIATLLTALKSNSERIADIGLNPAIDPMLLHVTAVSHAACAATLLEARAPDAALLRRVGSTVAERFRGLRAGKYMHGAGEYRLLVGAYAALLAHDQSTLQTITGLRPSLESAPLQWALLRGIAKHAVPNDEGLLICTDPDLRVLFMRLFQSERIPFGRLARPVRDDELMLHGPLVGAYYYAWIYLQSFAPEPTVATDWDVLRELLIG